MSKWVNDDAFGKFQEAKKEEKTQKSGFGIRRSERVWNTPEKGTETVAKEYIGRFIPDPSNVFYKLYYYHMFRVGEKWFFDLCEKTHDFETYCPICSATQKLWMGTATDKKSANNYKRKRKFVGNWYVVKDLRDEGLDEDDKAAGNVKLYEFPQKVEMKLKEELTDSDEGLGPQIFDPGKNGHNFILKVLSTKPTKEGDTWPDYAQSLFSRKASALGTNAEIEEIMGRRIDVNEYIAGLKKSEDEVEKALREEMIYELIKDEWNKVRNKEEASESNGIVQKAADSLKEDDIDDSKMEIPESLKREDSGNSELKSSKEDNTTSPFHEDDNSDSDKKTDDMDQSDAELLAELSNL